MEFPAYKKVRVEDLIPYARNSRTHSDEQVAQIAASIREFGFLNPVVLDGENGLLAGHGRVLAARKLGLAVLPAIDAAHLTDAQRRAYVIADNKLALNAGWDIELLKVEIADLKSVEFDLGLLGFSDFEMDAFAGDLIADNAAEWEGMPEYEDPNPCFRKVVVNFVNQEGVDTFFATIGQTPTEKTKSIWFPAVEKRDLKAVRWADDEPAADAE